MSYIFESLWCIFYIYAISLCPNIDLDDCRKYTTYWYSDPPPQNVEAMVGVVVKGEDADCSM